MQRFGFHPVVARWFEQKFGTPTEPQERGWPAIQSGAHTLIAAPTGSGKTLAAFMAALDQLFREGLAGKLANQTRVLYVSPLKALSNDIHKNLEEPLMGIRAALVASEGRDIEVRAEVRTGDTPASKRQAIAKKPPHILVTTPESFYLLLTSQSGRNLLATVRALIVDEIHAVVSNRRGSHLSLSVERLQALVKGPLQRIGLSATQKPIEGVARFLVGTRGLDDSGNPRCAIIDSGYARKMDLAIELPGSPLEAVMSNEVWSEVYSRLADLIEAHRTTLVFVNTRRMAERVTRHLSERLGEDKVTSHHGSLSARLRLDAENRLKRGELKALVATASLELGIDIGSVDLVCQLGPTRSIATLLQRVGRAEHQRGGLPKGRLFPLSRDELVECAATLRCVRIGELDRLQIPEKPLDLLAQQMVACAACEDWQEQKLLDLVRSAYPYRHLTQQEFDDVLRMLAEGFSTKRGRRAALIHHDAVNHRVRGRRGARLIALTSGGAIPDNADIFQLGNASWRIVGINSGAVRVADAHGQPPGIPFWLGEAPGRTRELSRAVSELRVEMEAKIGQAQAAGALQEACSRGRQSAHSQNIQPRLTSAPTVPGPDARPKLEVETSLEAAHDQTLTPALSLSEGERQNPAPRADQTMLAEQSEASATVFPLHRGGGEGQGEGTSDLAQQGVVDWLMAETGLSESGTRQLADYFTAAYRALGVIPSQQKIVMERFFDESGGMQLVIHAPFGIRLNRAWGLALRKRFCRSFNFELQAAATDDAIVLSLGTQHSFPLEEVFRYLNSKTVRELLVQALLDAPMFPIRWRWNATRALALPRQRGGRKLPAPLQRMEAENLIASVFPDQLACLENIAGDREIPDHPLVRQTVEDCLTEAMDIDGLIELLKQIESGTVECIARDLPEPSPLAHEILNAKPYAFLDNAPLEERRTQAVYTRRASESSADRELGILDAAAIERVCEEAWPRASNADELHEALMLLGVMTVEDVRRTLAQASLPASSDGIRAVSPENGHGCPPNPQAGSLRHAGGPLLESLMAEKRAGRLTVETGRRREEADSVSENSIEPSPRQPAEFWVAAERLPMLQAVYPGCEIHPEIIPPESEYNRPWERADAIRELVRGRIEAVGPVTARGVAGFFRLSQAEIDTALWALEAEGFVLRGRFHSNEQELEWCDRRLLARIHRLTIHRLRAEIQPVSPAEFQRFLLAWQRVDAEHRAEGPEGVEAVLELLDGYELPAASWEPEVLALRVKEYTPQWLDRLCFTGRVGWGRLTPPQNQRARAFTPLRSSPVSLFARDHLPHWLALSIAPSPGELSPDTGLVLKTLDQAGALFFNEIVRHTGLLPSRAEQALGELAARGCVTADSFEGLRALLIPSEKRAPFADVERKRRHKTVTSIEFAGRWSLLRTTESNAGRPGSTWNPERGTGNEDRSLHTSAAAKEQAIETYARVLLRRYGVVFRRLLERESLKVSWFELGRVYRRLEARGEIRGGYFVSGVSGEQFALPEAVGLLRSLRKAKTSRELIALSAADPLNLVGILTSSPRVAAVASNRIVLCDGLPIAALEAGQVTRLEAVAGRMDDLQIERALKVGNLPVGLRPYYA
ncbi:MAG: ATP-dependent DNA helicase [Verrucomicrobia bacterium]|nr:MAG: ATP-dependent DNA helicase [Verrucomicrobiota bacterium]